MAPGSGSACGLPVAPCDLEERTDSACSSLIGLSLQGGEGSAALSPAAPPTPEHEPREHAFPGQCSPLAAPAMPAAMEAALTYALQAWRQQLMALQPLVQLGDEILLGALAVMKELLAARPDLEHTLQASMPHLYTYLAAALWLASKLGGVRTSIPNRSLMSQATRVDAKALSDFELDLLVSLDWDVASILARQGLLC